jgi:signal transduction histidine kinase
LAPSQRDPGEQRRQVLLSAVVQVTLEPAPRGLLGFQDALASPAIRREKLAPTVASTAYFTVCEALANTVKHGNARQASVALALDDGRLRIDVADDGQGFDPTDVAASSGLTGLRDRLAAIGGTLDVQSAPGSGTTLTAIVPAHP